MSGVNKPRLSLPQQEALCVSEAYSAASIILEYGSGGSTLMAAEMPGKIVFSVESDPNWTANMQAWFESNPPQASKVILHHGNIGLTEAWGNPASKESFRQWPDYPLSVWQRDDFQHPDVVLIDGRFRAACFLATQFMISRPVTVLIDDYIDRPFYHRVEEIAGRATLFGRMARFEIVPRPLPVQRLSWIIDAFLVPL